MFWFRLGRLSLLQGLFICSRKTPRCLTTYWLLRRLMLYFRCLKPGGLSSNKRTKAGSTQSKLRWLFRGGGVKVSVKPYESGDGK